MEAPPYAVLSAVSGVAPDDYWSVGDRIIDHGADQRVYAEHWDGRDWREVPTPRPEGSFNEVFTGVVALNADNAWAVGWAQPGQPEVAPFAEHWNGRTWTAMYLKIPKGSRDTQVWDVDATSGSDVWAVGDAGSFMKVQPLIEHWSGAGWSISTPAQHEPSTASLAGVSALRRDDVWAVGYKRIAGHVQPLAEHYDGTTWRVVDVPLPQGQTQATLNDVAGLTSDDVWSVGTTATKVHHPVIEHWDGSTWQPARARVTGADMVPTSVAVVASDDVWVVGYTHDRHAVFLHWDGSAFHEVQVKTGTALFRGIAFTSPSDAMAVGIQNSRRGGHPIVIPAHSHWNGHAWSDQS